MKGHNKGVLLSFGPERGDTQERQTYTCGHCGRVRLLTAADRLCHCCANFVCEAKACNATCEPFLKKILAHSELAYRRQQNAKVLGV